MCLADATYALDRCLGSLSCSGQSRDKAETIGMLPIFNLVHAMKTRRTVRSSTRFKPLSLPYDSKETIGSDFDSWEFHSIGLLIRSRPTPNDEVQRTHLNSGGG